jgi:N-acetylmuramoyl-L-alanine amidase
MTREQLRAALTDEIALTCTMLGEAASEPIEGQIAVACVIRNRVRTDLGKDGKDDWWGEGYRAVCLKRLQFSCWWEVNANTARVYATAEAMLARQPLTGVLAQMRWIAEGVIGDVILDRTRGADHYLTTALLRSPAAPTWAKPSASVGAIGAHTFFRLG